MALQDADLGVAAAAERSLIRFAQQGTLATTTNSATSSSCSPAPAVTTPAELLLTPGCAPHAALHDLVSNPSASIRLRGYTAAVKAAAAAAAAAAESTAVAGLLSGSGLLSPLMDELASGAGPRGDLLASLAALQVRGVQQPYSMAGSFVQLACCIDPCNLSPRISSGLLHALQRCTHA